MFDVCDAKGGILFHVVCKMLSINDRKFEINNKSERENFGFTFLYKRNYIFVITERLTKKKKGSGVCLTGANVSGT